MCKKLNNLDNSFNKIITCIRHLMNISFDIGVKMLYNITERWYINAY